eukprot:g15890.t1
MSANMRTIIEPMDVEVASPATISRNGMVFFEPHLMGYQHLIDKTLKGGLPKDRVARTNSRPMFGSFLRKLLTGQESPKPPKKIQPNLPDRGSVFDYVVDLKQPGWTTWMDTVEAQSIPNSAQVQNIIVQTVDNVRYRHLLEHCIEHRMKLLFCGPTGTGKTVYMQQALMAMPKETHIIIDVVYFAAMGPPGGGRNFITPRILGHMYLVGFPLLDDDNMMQIFNTVLEWKFRAENYPAEVASLSKKMVQATLEIYKNTSNELRPTPMKVHYTFNLRDFSKVICGVLLLKKNECDGASRHVRLWAHDAREILRVFGDRLIDDHDREWMMHQLREQTKKNFQVSFDEIMIHLDTNKDGKVNTLDEVRTLFFGDMLILERKIVAVGKNYRKHIAEMAQIGSAKDEKFSAEAPKAPVLFLKPTTSYLPMGAGPILLPVGIGPVHHEVELGIVIGKRCKRVPEAAAMEVISGYCVALDLTARDLQTAAKDRGLPWSEVPDPTNLELFCEVNGQQRQRGHTGDMIFKPPQLIAEISKVFTLEPGDLILTGTPEGVGPIEAGDKIRGGITGIAGAEINFDVAMDAECPDVAVLQKEIEAHLVSYNEMSSKPMDLVCFLYMLEHLARVARVIKSPGGNALLVGLGGSGRQSCTRLACYMADFAALWQPVLGAPKRCLILVDPRHPASVMVQDMKKMLTKAGGSEERTIFLFSDTQIKDEGFVEDVNNLLNTGEIPNLFPAEEADAAFECLHLCPTAALCAARLATRGKAWPQLGPQLLALGQRGLAEEALKVMSILAEEGYHDSVEDMTEAALTSLRSGTLPIRLAALQALTSLSHVAQAKAAVLAAALQAGLLEACVEGCYNILSLADLDKLMVITQISVAEDPDEVVAEALHVWEALAAQGLQRGGVFEEVAPVLPKVLVPLVLNTLERKQLGWQEEDSSLGLQESACQCLMAMSEALADRILETILAFLRMAFASEEPWQRRAAFLAFGAPMIHKMLPLLLEALKAPDTEASAAAWALGRVLERNPASVPDEAQASLFELAIVRLREPALAEQLCYCLEEIADQQAAVLEPMLFGRVVEALLSGATEVEEESRAHLALFGCLLDILGRAGEDCLEQMELVLQEVMRRLQLNLAHGRPGAHSLFRSLRVLLFRLGPRATPRAEQIGELLKRSLSLDATEEEGQDGNGAKEALRVIGSLALLTNTQACLQALGPFLLKALQQPEIPCACKAATQAIAQLAKAVGEAASCILLPAADALVPLLAVHPLWATRCLAAIFQVLGARTPRLPELLTSMRSALTRILEELLSSFEVCIEDNGQVAHTDLPGRGPRLRRAWISERTAIKDGRESGREALLEAVLSAHESLLRCSRSQGMPLGVPLADAWLLSLLPHCQTSCAKRTALLMLAHLAEDPLRDLRAFLAADGHARACVLELATVGAAAANKAQREADPRLNKDESHRETERIT